MSEEITEVKTVWVAWSNTDLTEGKGIQYPYAIADNPITAQRLGRKQGVHGGDCDIRQDIAVKVSGEWMSRVKIESPLAAEKEAYRLSLMAEDVAKKARKLGLSEEEIELLKNNKGC